MTDQTKTLCPNCRQPAEKAMVRIGGKLYCEKCRPADQEEQTVAFTADGELKTISAAPDDPGSDRTVATDNTAPDKTVAADGATLAAAPVPPQAEENRTVADGRTQDIGATVSSDNRTVATGIDGTRATTVFTMNKSLAATKVIKEMLNIEPDVDLEQASRLYFNRKGVKADNAAASSINDLITRSGEEKKYIFDKELGRGGMGAVFSTVDQDIRRKVAMKVMLPGVSKSSSHLKRFLEEAQVTGQLEHPNIVPVHDIGIDEESKIYFTMKLVRGENLESIITKVADGDEAYREKYGLGTLLQIFMKICEGIGYSHSKGVLHRDLKPENIMVGDFGEVMVMDWGLAKVLGRDDIQAAETSGASPEKASSLMTMEGQVMGTPSYMSPEQAQGKVSELDERSDVFSLGGILYKIITYKAPYRGKNAREALNKARKRLLIPPDVQAPDNLIPTELSAVCMKAMARDKEDRYDNALGLKQDIQLYLDGKSVSAKTDNILVKAKKWVVRNKVASMGIAAAIVCLIAGIILTALYEQKKKQDTIADLLNRATQARLSQRYEEAEEIFFSVLGLDKHSAQARRGIAMVSGKALALKNKRLAQDKIKEAQALFSAGNFVKAYEAFVATFTLDPESRQALEGIKVSALQAEKQKALEKIKPLLAQARRLSQKQQETDASIVRLQKDIKKRKEKIRGYEDFTVKKPVWDKEKALLSQSIDKLQTEGKIISTYSAVLGFDGENKTARNALAQLYYAKYCEAESIRDEEKMAYYQELTLAFDDGTRKALLQQDGTMTLATVPPAEAYYLYRFVEGPDRRMIPVPFSPEAYFSQNKKTPQQNQLPGAPPGFSLSRAAFAPIGELLTFSAQNRLSRIEALELPRGSYLAIARRQGSVDARIPFVVGRGDSVTVGPVPLLADRSYPDDFIYIPAGPFIMGGDPEAAYSEERALLSIDGFLIARTEVTVSDYLRFINYMEKRLPGSAEKYLPRKSPTSGYYWKKSGNSYQSDFPPDWPVLGISWNDARAYCRWLTLQNKDKGWEFRLPEDREWEKVARGADGRLFPWGNSFDYRFCSMAKSRQGKRDGPDPVTSFRLDESVYGVMDLAGSVSEWCRTYFDQEQNIRITRGAAWSIVDEDYARCAARTGHTPADVADYRGFRLAISLKK